MRRRGPASSRNCHLPCMYLWPANVHPACSLLQQHCAALQFPVRGAPGSACPALLTVSLCMQAHARSSSLHACACTALLQMLRPCCGAQVHAPGEEPRVAAGEVLARPGDAGALLARVQLFCRDFSAAGEQVGARH